VAEPYEVVRLGGGAEGAVEGEPLALWR
jgi:hypothetical protein